MYRVEMSSDRILFLQFGMGVVTEKQGKFTNLAFPNPVHNHNLKLVLILSPGSVVSC
jgi:hypothetical protein